MGALITGAIATLGGILVAHYIPQLSNYSLPAGLAVGGLATYLLDGKTEGLALMGAAGGLAVAPYVAGAVGGVASTKPSYAMVFGA